MKKLVKRIELGQLQDFISKYQEYLDAKIDPQVEKVYTESIKESRIIADAKSRMQKASSRMPRYFEEFMKLYKTYQTQIKELGVEPNSEVEDMYRNVVFFEEKATAFYNGAIADHKKELGKLKSMLDYFK